MTTHALIFFECLNQPLDAGYGTPFDDMAQIINLVHLDSFSESAHFELTSKVIQESEHVMMVVDSQKGSRTNGLFPLINSLVEYGGMLRWVGNHDMRQKSIAIADGKSCTFLQLQNEISDWINLT